MEGMRKGIQYIGVLDYNRSNEPRVFVNQLDSLQFSVKSQEEETFNIHEIIAFPEHIRNDSIKVNNDLAEEERIQQVLKYLKSKLFLFFIDRRKENKVCAIFPYVTNKPKGFNPKEPFAGIPVFAAKGENAEKEWNDERRKNDLREWDLRRSYKNFEDFCNCVKKGTSVGEIYGSAKDSLQHSFVLWREEEKIYAVGPIRKYHLEKSSGWTLEGNTNRIVCVSDVTDKMVYDVNINPTLAFVPVSVCKQLEETLQEEEKKKEDRDSAVTIPVFAPKNDPVEEEWNRKRAENGEKQWNSCRGYNDYPAFKEYIGVGKTLGNILELMSDTYNQSFILWREKGELFAVGPITECLTAWRVKINPAHKIRIGKITNKKVYNPEENPTIAKFPLPICKRVEELLTEMKSAQPESCISVPVFAAKNDAIEKEWFEKGKENGDTRFGYQRPYKNFSMWKEYIETEKGLSGIYGFLIGYFKQSFVLWREKEKLYVVGPITGYVNGGRGERILGNPTEKLPLSEFTDKTVCDIEENPTLAHIPESVCQQIEKAMAAVKWKRITGVRRSNTSKAWKYRSIEWNKRR